MTDCGVVVVGAGPYGLASSAHLRAAGVDVHTFGRPMEFWHRRMPRGMFLRSAWEASSIGHPQGRLTLDEYRDAHAPGMTAPIPIGDFLRYAEWFRQQAVPDVDEREIVGISQNGHGFRIALDDGNELAAERVVVATGLEPFAARPHQFDEVPQRLASHSADHTDFADFEGQRVLVVGGGQSALESAALLRESGAEVTAAVRATRIHWLPAPRLTGQLASARRRLYGPVIHRILYPSTDVGPPGLNWIVALPPLFRAFPRRLQEPMAQRCIRPAGGYWLRSRLQGAEISTRRSVVTARPEADRLRVTFDDGTAQVVDHALLATGFRIDIRRLPFLPPELAEAIVVDQGYPLLKRGFESSVPGLHFVGAPAARSFGPVMRFVSGTRFTGPEVTRGVLGRTSADVRRLRRRPAQAETDVARST